MGTSENNKKLFTFVVVAAVMLLVSIGAFTFAFFTANVTSNNNLSIIANFSDMINPVFTAYSESDLSVNVTMADMLNTGANANNTTIGDLDSQDLTVTLLAGGGASEDEVTCTFDIFLENTGEVYVPSSAASSAGLKEYTIMIQDGSGNIIVPETTVNTFINNSTTKAIIANDVSISSSGTEVTKKLNVTMTIYNLNVVQTIYNKTYSSRVGVTNVAC